MVPRRVLFAVAAAMLIAAAAFAQSADTTEAATPNPAIFGSVSGGELTVLAKTSQHWSGSFGIMTSASRYPFANSGISSGSSSNLGYNASLGGTLVKDRAWFFASVQRTNNTIFGSQFDSTLPQTAPSGALDAKAMGQIGDRQTLNSTFSTQQTNTNFAATPFRASTSFLSLNYTGLVSDNMVVTAKVTRSGGTATPQQ